MKVGSYLVISVGNVDGKFEVSPLREYLFGSEYVTGAGSSYGLSGGNVVVKLEGGSVDMYLLK